MCAILITSGGDGAYTSTVDGGKATSIISTSQVQSSIPDDNNRSIVGVGTVGADGKFFPLATSTGQTLLDVALALDGQFYGINSTNGGANF